MQLVLVAGDQNFKLLPFILQGTLLLTHFNLIQAYMPNKYIHYKAWIEITKLQRWNRLRL